MKDNDGAPTGWTRISGRVTSAWTKDGDVIEHPDDQARAHVEQAKRCEEAK